MSGSLFQTLGRADLALSLLTGAASYLTLGPVAFTGFEVPERLTWGGQQQMTVHKLPGGTRIIDTMGRDDAALEWSGVFFGVNAAERAYLVDELRIAGKVVPLAWASHSYDVVIASFVVDHTRPGMLGYRISCIVLADKSAAPLPNLAGIAITVAADLNIAAGLVTHPSAALALAAAQFAVEQAGFMPLGATLTNAANSALGAASSAVDGALSSVGASFASAASAAPAGSVVASVAGLGNATSQAGDMAGLGAARGFAGRAAANALTGAV